MTVLVRNTTAEKPENMTITAYPHDDISSEGGTIPEEVSGKCEDQPQAAPHDDYSNGDDASGQLREYTGVFEGPEKTLEVCFRTIGNTAPEVLGPQEERIGLRRLSRQELDRICARVRCTILSSVSNRYLDAYVLSESSLFVYPYMLVLKTCGTTTLLRCIALLIDLGRKLGLGTYPIPRMPAWALVMGRFANF